MKTGFFAFVAAIALSVLGSTAHAQTRARCEPIEASVFAPSDHVTIGVRRPAVTPPDGQTLRTYEVQVEIDSDKAAKSGGVEQVMRCGATHTLYRAIVLRETDGFQEVEISLPRQAKNIRIMSSSALAKKCWNGTFAGDRTMGVTLVEGSCLGAGQAERPTPVGGYRF